MYFDEGMNIDTEIVARLEWNEVTCGTAERDQFREEIFLIICGQYSLNIFLPINTPM